MFNILLIILLTKDVAICSNIYFKFINEFYFPTFKILYNFKDFVIFMVHCLHVRFTVYLPPGILSTLRCTQ